MNTPAAFVIDEIETWGGTEAHLYELVRALDPRFSPEVIVLGKHAQLERFRDGGVSVRLLPIDRTLHPEGLVGALRLAAALREGQRKLVVSYHTSADLLSPFAAATVGAVAVSSRRDMGFTKKPIHVRIQREVNRLLAGMTVVSEAVQTKVHQTEHFPLERMQVIHNGCDAAKYAEDNAARARVRQEFGFTSSDVVLGTLANFDPIKGYDQLIPVAIALCKSTPHIKFLLCGKGPLHEQFLAEVHSAGLAERILLPGARRDVPAILQALDLFVLASHSEGFSNALLEAMAAGLPVVATDVGGNRALVSPPGAENSIGIILPPGDAKALETAILPLIRTDARPLRQRMGQAARKRAAQDFTFDKMVRAYERTFDAFVDEIGGGGAKPSRRIAKRAIAGAYHATRPITALRQSSALLRATRKPANALVLCYHRVVETLVDPDPAMVVTTSTFKRQLETLGRHYTFARMDELAKELAHGGPRRPTVAITFDDGYLDNLTLALPVLRDVGAPASIYLTAGVMETGIALWPERVTAMVMSAANREGADASVQTIHPLFTGALAAARLSAIEPRASGELSPAALARLVVELLKEVQDELRASIIKTLESKFGKADRGALSRYLTWEDARTLAKAGIEIGSHTFGHPILTRTADAQIARELEAAKTLIRTHVGVDPVGFAYPNGDHDQRVRRLVEQAGHGYAVTLDSAQFEGDLFALGRRCTSEQQSRGYAGPFSAAQFLADVEGALDRFRSAPVRAY